MNKITFRNWSYTCGDGCCGDYGTEILVNGVPVTGEYADTTVDELAAILNAMQVPYEIEEVTDE